MKITEPQSTTLAYVIACGDEGVQINEGVRLGFVGAGIKLDGFDKVVPLLKKLFPMVEISTAANQENDWVKAKFELDTFEQTDATMQQHAASIADANGLTYAGYLPFADPKQLKHGIKGHMVRPKKVHIANKLCFTLGGGEQVYNLGHYVISADWLHLAPKKLAEQVIKTQVEFYTQLAGKDLELVFEVRGLLDEKIIKKNEKIVRAFVE